jgi:tetratricopeptide (TPR) repeat protein
VLLLQQRFAEAASEAQEGVRLSENGPRFVALAGYAYAKSGQTQEAQKVLTKLEATSRNEYVAPTHFALVYAGLGQKDKMFEWLEKAYQDRDVILTQALSDPVLAPLRGDPRFVDLIRRVGLPPPPATQTAP